MGDTRWREVIIAVATLLSEADDYVIMILSKMVSMGKPHPAVPGRSICSMKVPCAGDRRRVGGIWGGSGAIAERVSDELSGRDELRGVLV